MKVARKLCRNNRTTSVTSTTASKNVCTTFSMEASVNLLVSMTYLNSRPSGKLGLISSIKALTFWEVAIALAPGCW